LRGVPQGDFSMGASPDDPEAADDERPVRCVHLSHSFWMGTFPVTRAQYEAVMGTLPDLDFKQRPPLPEWPVSRITWGEAMAFCEELTANEREHLPPGYEFRLPTEAEWEYACRAGCPDPRYGPLAEVALCDSRNGVLDTVGQRRANDWGFHDLLGLVHEWCRDVYSRHRPTTLADPCCGGQDPGAPLWRVIRGGCFQGPETEARASAR
ncbi:MAG: SUMF1/EgtB/PvdO family nonheme iron enzyme, partial [Planctomycetaceae bacterium]|nr:SUMF1/EgtB/PvdO family nonheme iron enzyme [Planctomycetaceae bacterium]